MENQNLFIYKYQPTYLNEMGLDDEIVSVIKLMIDMNNLNIILSGSAATGKTTLISAIIKEYYGGISSKEYQDNLLYINNLKEQGINYYRSELKTFCQTSSVIKQKKKFVIFDDIDFINEQSQQVFRNCIDKFSNNVHFIASCDNIQKVIDSIQSRLIIVNIKQLKRENIYNLIQKVSINENITIDADAIDFIINVSNNTIKAILNYMEVFKLFNQHITLQIATELCTNINFKMFDKYTELVKQNNLQEAIKLIYDISNKGYSVIDILDNYFQYIKNTNLLNDTEKYDVIPLICKYITIFHNIHEDEIELALFTNNLTEIFQ